MWSELLVREGTFLLVLFALGAGPAAFLPQRFDAVSRIAMAPVLGYCLGSIVPTTAVQFTGLDSVSWLIVPIALASVATAAWRLRGISLSRLREHLPLRDAAALLCVAVAVVGPLSATLHSRHTVGPAVYYFTDVDAYVMQEAGMRTTNAADAASDYRSAGGASTGYSDLSEFNWGFRSDFSQQFDAGPIKAIVGSLFGFGTTDAFTPFLIVLLLAGALGAFAGVRATTRSRTWFAVLAGALFGGPFFVELFFDSFQAALVGLGLIIPLAVLAEDALTSGRRADVILAGLVISGFMTTYPIFTPIVALTVVAVAAWLAWRARGSGKVRTSARAVAARIAAIVVLGIVLEPIAFLRNLGYAKKVLADDIPEPRVQFPLTIDRVPGWIFQTREFWAMPSLSHGSAKELLFGLLIPIVLAAAVVVALVKLPRTRPLLVLGVICVALAEYTYHSQEACTYCADRNLLPLAPITIALLAIGLWVLYASRRQALRVAAVAVALLAVVAVGQRTRVQLDRFQDNAYFLDSANRTVLDALPEDRGRVQMEGYSAGYNAQAEEPLVYSLLHDRAPGRSSLSVSHDEHAGLSYLTFDSTSATPTPAFDPGYRYVLTRFAGVRSPRTTLSRSLGIGLQKRTQRLDVSPVSGLLVPLARLNPSGLPVMSPDVPLVLEVSGPASRTPVAVHLQLRASTAVEIVPAPGATAHARGPVIDVCLPATGQGAVRTAQVSAKFAPPTPAPPKGDFPQPYIPEGLTLTSMKAVDGRCATADG